MFRVDYHTHSEYSSDSNALIEEMMLRAISKGIKEIALTDHIDLDYPPVSYIFWESFDINKYEEERLRLKEKYDGTIRLVCGIEMGLQPKSKAIIENFMVGKEFDFVIGSTHCVDNTDLYEGDYSTGKTREQTYRGYFEDVLNSVKTFDIFDVYGHLDVICRYGGYKKQPMRYNDYKDIIDEILINIINKDKGIEINSSGYRYGLLNPHPTFEIVKRYKELGGEIITTGSDAHYPNDVASYFDEIYEMLMEAGFKYVTTFKKRKPIFNEIT